MGGKNVLFVTFSFFDLPSFIFRQDNRMNQIPCPRKLAKKNKIKYRAHEIEKDNPILPLYYWLKLKIMI